MFPLRKSKLASAVPDNNSLSRQSTGRLDWQISRRASQPPDKIIWNLCKFNTPALSSALSTSKAVVRTIVSSLMLFLFIILSLAAVIALLHDWQRAVLEKRTSEAVEIHICHRHYEANFCVNPKTRAPAMEAKCHEWLVCMHRDPDNFSRLTLLAQYLAEAFNTFVHGMSWRSMFFLMAVIQITGPIQRLIAEKVAEIVTRLLVE